MLNDEEFNIELEKFRDVETYLTFKMSVNRLVDVGHCAAISKLLQMVGGKWERQRATSTLGDTLPKERGLYMFVWRPHFTLDVENPPHIFRPSWVLYVGKAGVEDGTHDTIQQRYVSEYAKYVGGNPRSLWDEKTGDDRHARLSKYLSVRPLEFWFLLLHGINDILHLERNLIKIVNPPANRQHSATTLRVKGTEPA